MIKIQVGKPQLIRVVGHNICYDPNTARKVGAIKAVRRLANLHTSSVMWQTLVPLVDAKRFVEQLEEKLLDAHRTNDELIIEAPGAVQDELEILIGICFFYLGVSYSKLEIG